MSFLLKIASLILLAPIVFLLRSVLFKRERKGGFYILLMVHTLLLSFAVMSLLNLPVTILSDEVSFLGNKPVSNTKKERAYKFINDNFLLINNAFDKSLITNPGETEGDSTYIAITNRKKLSDLFNLLADDSNNIDLVVCDIGFDDTTSNDNLLFRAMSRLYLQNKLLVSVAGERCRNEVLRFPDNICGDVKDETNEKLFTTHHLRRPLFFSLPYQVYTSLNKLSSPSPHFFNLFLKETDSLGKVSWKMNTFLPQFFITDELLLENGFLQSKQNNFTSNDTDFIQTNTLLLRTLGNAISEIGKENFLDDIQQRKHNNKKNIILIGTFNGNEDLHRTAYAELHGPTIILNLIYSLYKEQNKVSVILILILICSFFIISHILFNRVFNKSTEEKIIFYPNLAKRIHNIRKYLRLKNQKANNKRTSEKVNTGFANLLIRFIFIEELHYWLLLILVLIIYWCFGILINAISIAVYFIAFETFAVHFGKPYLKSKTFKNKFKNNI